MTTKIETSIPSLYRKPILALSLIVLFYSAGFLFLCNIAFYLVGGAADWSMMNIPNGPIAISDPIYVALFGIMAVAGLLVAAQGGLRWSDRTPGRTAFGAGLILVLLAAVAFAATLWTFNLDDKWAYYHTSRNIFSEGVPNYNAGEWFNINTSFIYPYLTLPGTSSGISTHGNRGPSLWASAFISPPCSSCWLSLG
jgi:hypothetical protein